MSQQKCAERQNALFSFKIINMKYERNDFTNRVVNAWNSLPDHVVYLCYLKLLTLLNRDLINFDNIKILFMISK